MKRILLLIFITYLPLFVVAAEDAPAALATGTLTGVVLDRTTGEALEGARIVAVSTSNSTTTQRDGSYTLRLPVGEHVVVAQYSGFNSVSHTVLVRFGEAVIRSFEFDSTVAMDAYVVDFRRGEAEEIMLRRQATNIVDVVSSKTFGEMADGSLSISRLAGMTGGTGIRGISGEFNLVRVDGAALATPSDSTASGTTRSVNINQIPGDMIERIEVFKSPRPDMDADAVGGTINLITKSALDRSGRRTSYSFGGMYSPSYEVKKMGYLASLEHSDILGSERRLGYSFTLNHNRRYSNKEEIVTDYFTDQVSGISVGGPAPVSSFRAAQELRYEDRTGMGLKFDYKPRDTFVTQFGVLYQTSFAHIDSADWRLTNRNNLLSYDTEGGFWYAPSRVRSGRGNIDGAVPLRDASGKVVQYSSGRGQGGVLNTFTDTITDFLSVRQLRYNNRAQEQYRDTYTFNLGGRYTGLDMTKIEFAASYSWGKAKRREWPDGLGTYQYDLTGSNVRIDRSKDFYHPEVTFTGGTSPTNVDAIETVNLLQLLDATQVEEQVGLTLHVERELRTRIPITLKSGLRYRGVDRDIDRGEHQYKYLGKNADFVGTDSINPFGLYPTSLVPDIDRVREKLKSSPELFEENMLLFVQKQNEHNGHISEKIQGAYVQGEARFGKLTVLSGLRQEWTRTKGTATVRDEGKAGTPEEWTGKRTERGKYDNIFPHFHVRQDLSDNFVVRGAWSTGIGRPPWKNILPEGVIVPENQVIEMNNPDLRPQYTHNFDLGVEYYIKSGGLFGINLFRKEIEDLIFAESRIIGPDDGFDPAYEGWELQTYGNSAWAWVRGIEFDYRQQLTFLPGVLKNFGVFANLTLLETEGNYSTPDGSVTSDIPGFVPRMINAGVSYTDKRVSARVLVQHQAERLSEWDERTTEFWRYKEASTTVDVFAGYKLSRRFSLFMNISNLFEDSPIEYQARPNQPRSVSKTSRRFDFGIRGSL